MVEIKVIDSAEYSGSKDAVLVYKKESRSRDRRL